MWCAACGERSTEAGRQAAASLATPNADADSARWQLEVGVIASPFSGDKGLTFAETRTHFAAWAIVSSPLTLSHDPNNRTIMDFIWPIISNKEVCAERTTQCHHMHVRLHMHVCPLLPTQPRHPCSSVCTATGGPGHSGGARCRQVLSVSQTYAGHSGSPFAEAKEHLTLAQTNPALLTRGLGEEETAALPPLRVPAWQFLYKPLAKDGTKVAVLLMNHAAKTAHLSFQFTDVPGLACSTGEVRDVWAHKDLGVHAGGAWPVASHDTAFFILTCSQRAA